MRLNRNGKGCSARPRGSSVNKKKLKGRRGGGPAPVEPSDASKLIVEVYAPGFSGIIGGFESGEYQCYHYFTRAHLP